MTAVSENSAYDSYGAQTVTGRRRRGRPRPLETIRRDEHVLEVLSSFKGETRTRKEIADHLGWEGKAVFACLSRLRVAGKVEKVNGNNWRTTSIN